MKELPIFEAIKEAEEAAIPYINGAGEPLPWEAEEFYRTQKIRPPKNTGESIQTHDTAIDTR